MEKTWNVTLDVGLPTERNVTVTLAEYKAYVRKSADDAMRIFNQNVKDAKLSNPFTR